MHKACNASERKRGIIMDILSEKVLDSLSDTMILWAGENLVGKPVILLYSTTMRMKELLREKTQEINDIFK